LPPVPAAPPVPTTAPAAPAFPPLPEAPPAEESTEASGALPDGEPSLPQPVPARTATTSGRVPQVAVDFATMLSLPISSFPKVFPDRLSFPPPRSRGRVK